MYRGVLAASVAFFAFASPASAFIVSADITGKANGTIQDFDCTSTCVLLNTSNITNADFTASIESDATNFDVSFLVNGVDPITFNTSVPGSVVADYGETLTLNPPKLHYVLLGALNAPGLRVLTVPDLLFTFAGNANFMGVTGSVSNNTRVGVAQRQISFTISEASVTGGANVVGVPEPATWAMMIAGFGLVGAASRRRVSIAPRLT